MNPVPRRGCLYSVEIRGERTGKKRPALVIAIDARDRYASDVLVVPASTVQRGAPTHVHLRKGEGGVRRDCVLKCERIMTLSKELLSERALGGEVSGTILEQVERRSSAIHRDPARLTWANARIETRLRWVVTGR